MQNITWLQQKKRKSENHAQNRMAVKKRRCVRPCVLWRIANTIGVPNVQKADNSASFFYLLEVYVFGELAQYMSSRLSCKGSPVLLKSMNITFVFPFFLFFQTWYSIVFK